jgi:coenzyme PQQ precursor peptide PqqA
MTWNTPTLVEICIGLEINGYLPAEFWFDFWLFANQKPGQKAGL